MTKPTLSTVDKSKSDFEFFLTYDQDQIINKNFTISSKLTNKYDKTQKCNPVINKCLATLSLRMKLNNDGMIIEVWCHPPSLLLIVSHDKTCIMSHVDVSRENTTIEVTLNAHTTGTFAPMMNAKFYDHPSNNLQDLFGDEIRVKNSPDEYETTQFPDVQSEVVLERNIRDTIAQDDIEPDDLECIAFLQSFIRESKRSNQSGEYT
ncbi:unnamed protein product [Didymodactylos carnosus]|uniref:Uncharacterized protein n=1 Tax=Didymodactylos carnosus TaxID=1234261 RepID=A0A8S2I067_9BILA|nr:unnamed protein product [Didymodactylos carnosus]CAF3635664.1 unnamed protein product [Didymodactylos carnosus]CAF3684042.1 unnamed protein product [Didymodactylos carnosus]